MTARPRAREPRDVGRVAAARLGDAAARLAQGVAAARLGAAAALVAGLAPGVARADDVAYRRYPLGGRAVALGGAFTALGDDSSGLYYNPAGLVDVPRGSAQVGANLFGLEVQGGVAEAFGAVVDFERVVGELDIIPAAASAVSVLGHGEDGRASTVLALGSFVPSSRRFETSLITALDEDERFPGCGRLAYERTQSDRRFLVGAGVGQRLDARWSLGLAGYIGYRALFDREEIACSDPDATVDATPFSTADTRLSLSVLWVQVAVALKVALDDGWRLGAQLAAPSVRAYGQAGLRVRRSQSLPAGAGSQFVLEEVDDARADTREGLTLRLGAARVWDAGASTVALDVSLHAPSRFTLVQLPPERASLLAATTLANDVERRAVVNLAFGAERALSDRLSLGGGVFTNFSSAPPIPDRAGRGFAEDRLPHVQELGATLVGGLRSRTDHTRVGVILTYGQGADVVPRYAGLAAVGGRNQYVRAEVEQAAIYLFVSSTVSY